MFLLNPFVHSAPPPPAPTGPAFDSATAPSGVSLSNGDLTATFAALRSVRSATAITGAVYFEFHIDAFGTEAYCGVVNGTHDLGSWIGNRSSGWAYANDGRAWRNEDGFTGATGYGSTFTTGDVIGVAVNGANIWVRKNGVWQASGDPAAGTGAMFTTMFGTLYAAAAATSGGIITARFSPDDWSDPAPAGFGQIDA